MATLKARRILGNQYTPDDTLELQLTYDGNAHSCEHWIEVISGATVTHGGGASATTPLHYKAWLRDDGSSDAVDGVINYSSSEMTMVQTEKGTTVVKACANLILQTEYDAFKTEHDAWVSSYCTDTEEDGVITRTIAEGAPAEPAQPTPTVVKSGEITLVWSDDTFV